MPNVKTLRILTILIAIFLAIASVAGSFFPGTYERDSASMAAQGAGQDLVNLFLGVPLLLVSFVFTTRGKRTWTLIYAGVLSYIMYSFIIYCFGVYFNRFFLVYCATLGLSLYAFILVVSGLKAVAVERWFEKAPVRLVSGYMFFVALVFYSLWLKSVVPAIIHGEVPAEVTDYKLLVNPVHVIDMVFALPALIIGSVLLWKQRGLGYIIASIAMVFMILLTIALAAMVVMVVVKGINEDFTVALVFGVLSVTSTIFTILLFRKIRTTS
jgi:hypothetical protein